MSRMAVEYFWPGTMAGDGRPVTGVAVIDALTPGGAWDEFVRQQRTGERDLRDGDEVVLRVSLAEDLGSLTPLRHVVDRLGLR